MGKAGEHKTNNRRPLRSGPRPSVIPDQLVAPLLQQLSSPLAAPLPLLPWLL